MTSKSAPSGKLFNVLGFPQLLAIAIGLVVSQGVMVIMLQGTGLGGLGFIIPLIIAYVLALSYVDSFSELSLMFPKAGSVSIYTEAAIGHFPAIVATLSGYLVVAVFALAAEFLLVDLLLTTLYPFIPQYLAGGVMFATLTILNILGVDIFAKLQSVLAYVMILVLFFVGFSAVGHIWQPAAESVALSDLVTDFASNNPLGIGVFSLIAIAIWGFVGAEFVCPMIEETKEPNKTIPKSMFWGVTIIFTLYLVYCYGALKYVPLENLASDPLPHLTYFEALFGKTGLTLLTVAAITATASTTNTSFAAVPRLLYGMAENGQIFKVLGKIHPKYKTPWVAILFVAILTVMPIFVFGLDAGGVGLLLVGASMAWLLAYIIIHIDVIVLRRRRPDLARPYKSRFFPFAQIIGILGMGFAAIYNTPSPELTKQVFSTAGIVILAFAIFAAIWVKFVMKRGLFTPEKAE